MNTGPIEEINLTGACKFATNNVMVTMIGEKISVVDGDGSGASNQPRVTPVKHNKRDVTRKQQAEAAELKRIEEEKRKGKNQANPTNTEVEDVDDTGKNDENVDEDNEGEGQGVGAVAFRNVAEIIAFIDRQKNFSLNEEMLKETLENYIMSIAGLGDNSYVSGEIEITYYLTPTRDVMRLIAAGTKVLDAIMYSAVEEGSKEEKIFRVNTQLDGLTATETANNISNAKKAFQAAVILVFVRGNLPITSENEKRELPKFVRDHVYGGKGATTFKQVAKHLSSAPLRKFPARIFLKVSLDKLPVPVACRCKVSIAGNKAVRYAWYCGKFESVKDMELEGVAIPVLVQNYMRANERNKKTREITAYLRGLSWKAQLNLHPLNPTRPTIKKLTLKLTRIILESLSAQGRERAMESVDQKNISAFKADTNFYGIVENGARTWPILENEEANFDEITLETVKNIYSKEV